MAVNHPIGIGMLLFIPAAVLAQSSAWENWNRYTATYDYGPSTTYVNMDSRVTISSSPEIYSFEARIAEEGVSPEQQYRLLVNCTARATMFLSHDSTHQWVQATGKFARIVADACR